MLSHLSTKTLDSIAMEIASPQQSTRASIHLSQCARCRAALEARAEIVRMLTADSRKAPEKIADETWAQNAKRALERGGRTHSQRRQPRRFLFGAAGWRYAAMALIFFAGYGLRALQYSPPQPVWKPLRETNFSGPVITPLSAPLISRDGTAYRLAQTTTTVRIDDARM